MSIAPFEHVMLPWTIVPFSLHFLLQDLGQMPFPALLGVDKILGKLEQLGIEL